MGPKPNKSNSKKETKVVEPTEVPEQTKVADTPEVTPEQTEISDAIKDAEVKDVNMSDEEDVKKQDGVNKDKVDDKKGTVTVNDFDTMLAYALSNVSEDSKHIIYALENFKTLVDKGDVKTTVSAKYTLSLAIKKLINEPDYNKFKAGFNVLNKFFMADDGKYLGQVFHASDDLHWKFGTNSKLFHNLIIEMLNRLSNPSTRADELRKLNVSNIFKYLDENGVRNLTRFYQL